MFICIVNTLGHEMGDDGLVQQTHQDITLELISKFAFEAKASGFERSEVKNLEEYRDMLRNF